MKTLAEAIGWAILAMLLSAAITGGDFNICFGEKGECSHKTASNGEGA